MGGKFRARFIQEARTQQGLDPNFVLPVISRSNDNDENGAPWFTMPEAERSLRPKISILRAEPQRSAETLAHVLDALEYLHELDYVHRELKPANILLHDGRWKLADFGLVLPPSTETTALTSQESVWGTAAYMAPEQATSFHLVDHRADIYSLGCILHDLADGRARLPHAQLQCAGPLGDVVAKATASVPLHRYQTVAAMRPDLMA